MKDYKILLISFILLLFMIGAVNAASLEKNSISDDPGAYIEDDSVVIIDDPVIIDDSTVIDDHGDLPPVDTKDIYVNSTGDDSNLGTEQSPYASVSKAFSDVNASNDATIHIGEGTFLLEGSVVHFYEDYGDGDYDEWDEEYNGLRIDLNHGLYGGNLKFIGAGADKTFLDGQSAYFFASIGTESNVTIKDITFINCNSYTGGTIFNEGNLTIDNCVFKDSSSEESGGAIQSLGPEKMINTGMWVVFANVNCNLAITNSKFVSCSSWLGGAIFAAYTNMHLENNTFIETSAQDGVAIYSQYVTQDTKSSLIGNKFINLTGSSSDASVYVTNTGNSFSIVGNEFINCSTPSEQYSTVTLKYGNYIFENNTFSNSTNSVGNIYCGNSLNKLNFAMDYEIYNVSNYEASKGFKLNKVNITDDMGNIVRLGSITANMINDESKISRNIGSSNGEFTLTFGEVPENGIYNLTLTSGDSTSDVLAIVNVSLSNDPVELWVSPEGFDGNNGTFGSPFATIQHAIDVGFDNSFTVIVHLLEGTYTKDGNVELTIANKGNLQIIGEKYNETIIDGESTSWFLKVSTTNVNISNLKFINGKGQSKDLISGGNKLYLYNCIMENNYGRSDSRTYYALTQTKFDKLVYTNNKAKIYVRNCDIADSYFANNYVSNGAVLSASGVTIKNSKFINNTASSGNGGAITGSLTSIGNYYEDNHAVSAGGAVYVTGKSEFVDDVFVNNNAVSSMDTTQGGAIAISYDSYELSNTPILSFENCKFINNSAGKGGAVSLKIGKFNNCSFINNTADYGGAFYLVPYIKVDETGDDDEEPVVIEEDPIVIDEDPIPIQFDDIIIIDNVLGAGLLPTIEPIPIDLDDDPVEEETINSLILNDVTFENNAARFNGDDVYLEMTTDWWEDEEYEPAFGIPLTITFNDLNVTSLVDDLTATIYGPCGAVVGANYLSFEFDGNKIGSAPVLNSVATFNYAGFEDGDYILSGTVEYPNAKNVVNSGFISVKLENIVDHTDVWISADGSDEDGNGSQANPFKSISKAISESVKNCRDITIHIGEGVYTGDLNTELTISSMNNITLIGEGIDKTIIDGENLTYFAKITNGNNKVVLSDLTIRNMMPSNVEEIYGLPRVSSYYVNNLIQDLHSPIVVDEGANLCLDNVNVNNCHGGKAIFENNGNLEIVNSIINNNGIVSNAIIYGGTVIVNNTIFEENFAAGPLFNAKSYIYNSEIKNSFHLYAYSLIKGSCVIENTKISNEGNNASLKQLGYGNETTSLIPALSLDDDVLANNISMICNFGSILLDYQAGYGDGSQNAPFGYLYGGGSKNVTVTNSSFTNFKYLWCVNTYGQVLINLDGCLFDNITMIAQSQTPGEGSQYNITNSVFINCDPVIDRFSRSDRDDPDCIFENNYWGSNDKPVVTFVNPGKNPSFEPETWIILVEEDDALVFKTTDGKNVTDYEGSLPVELSYVADENGDVIVVLNIGGDGYIFTVDENGTVVLNTTEVMRNIEPKYLADETVFANDTAFLITEGSNFTAVFTDIWGDPLQSKEVTILIGDEPVTATTDENGVAVFLITQGIGQYTVNVTNPVTEESVIITLNITTDETLFANDVDSTLGDGSEFLTKFTDEFGKPIVNATVTFIVCEEEISATTDEDGIAAFEITQDLGIHTVTVTNPVTGEVINKTITVTTNVTTSASDVSLKVGDEATFSAAFTDKFGQALSNTTVTFLVDGNEVSATTDENGIATFEITQGIGIHTVTVTNPATGEVINKTVTVTAKSTIDDSSNKTQFITKVGDNTKFSAAFTDEFGNPLENATVTFIIGETEVNATTDANGVASVELKLDAGNYDITVINTATGESFTKTATVNQTAPVNNSTDSNATGTTPANIQTEGTTPSESAPVKATPKLTAKNKAFKAKVKIKKYTVTLKDNTGKVMKKVKLTLKIKGKTYKATTNKKGKATFKIKKLTKKGKYTAKVRFAGNAKYNAVTKKVKITVKK